MTESQPWLHFYPSFFFFTSCHHVLFPSFFKNQDQKSPKLITDTIGISKDWIGDQQFINVLKAYVEKMLYSRSLNNEGVRGPDPLYCLHIIYSLPSWSEVPPWPLYLRFCIHQFNWTPIVWGYANVRANLLHL